MKRPPATPVRGFTRADLLLLVIAVALLLALLWPGLALTRARAHQARCLSNLKQIAGGCRLWAHANSGTFPWTAASPDSAPLGSADWANLYRACSNELGSPRILVCPSDRQKRIAAGWAHLNGDRNISFFAGLDADAARPQTIVAGDRNIHGGGRGLDLAWSREMGQSIDAAWANTIHVNQGEIALADGSAQRTKTPALREQISAALQSGSQTVTFSLPRGPVSASGPR
jgi:hypothetical protein